MPTLRPCDYEVGYASWETPEGPKDSRYDDYDDTADDEPRETATSKIVTVRRPRDVTDVSGRPVWANAGDKVRVTKGFRYSPGGARLGYFQWEMLVSRRPETMDKVFIVNGVDIRDVDYGIDPLLGF